MRIFPTGALRFCAALALTASMAACGGGDNKFPRDDNPKLSETVSVSPENTGDGWPVSAPAAEGIDANGLLTTLENIRDGRFPGVDSMLIVRHGKLVAEGYFNGYGRDTLHDLRSTGKSVTSALAGIAIEQGAFGPDDPIAQLLPGFENHRNMSDRKRAITVRHLLDMSAGLDCNDWDPSSPGQEEKMYDKRDWTGFILDLPMVREPGAAAAYCTGGVVVLGKVISTRSGMALDAFAAAYLFGPLGIQQSDWRRSPDGQATGGGGLRLRPRDAAKFGALYAAGGTWNGTRVLAADWVAQSQQLHYALGRDGYGLLWWKRKLARTGGTVDSYFTSGNGGNFIFVIPALDMVAVFTGSNYNDDTNMNQPFRILESSVLPSVQ
jgi:CubicO group peptidase (beta-lactamase class C family)